MCGRYTIIVSLEELIVRFQIDEWNAAHYKPRYNLAPGQAVYAVVEDHEGKHRLGELKWGLVPSWSKDEKSGFKMINARAETADIKPAFKMLLERKRCLIPADGYYEWKKTENGAKQPYRFRLKSGKLFAMAGLYDSWISPEGSRLSTCTILTTVPNRLTGEVHDRMPVILKPEHEGLWLNREIRSAEPLKPLFAPYPEDEMETYPVDPRVGNVATEGPACIELYTKLSIR
ncbi:SOS response-associated peptidase [Gorillibacterium massiliense]|uniref:SOS response-associated peptidase n=1 Tax=Gorillibacterium massiliense TaxID=1280390 RepID=UPI0004B0FAAD|nr:SOS response-associated peptidase [Gorillibacterium massiliense]